MTNSADPDLLASWKPTDLALHSVCKGRVYPGSAGLGLILVSVFSFLPLGSRIGSPIYFFTRISFHKKLGLR